MPANHTRTYVGLSDGLIVNGGHCDYVIFHPRYFQVQGRVVIASITRREETQGPFLLFPVGGKNMNTSSTYYGQHLTEKNHLFPLWMVFLCLVLYIST